MGCHAAKGRLSTRLDRVVEKPADGLARRLLSHDLAIPTRARDQASVLGRMRSLHPNPDNHDDTESMEELADSRAGGGLRRHRGTEQPRPRARSGDGPAPAAAPTPTLEQRVAGLEAYFGNGDASAALKGADGTIPEGLTMATAGVSGPGHNAFMMICAALVLFMTLPGLALFYGGLVRRKNVLSVLAQCLGIAGLVTILWWAFGYSMVFADGEDMIKGFVGNLNFSSSQASIRAPNTELRATGFRRTCSRCTS